MKTKITCLFIKETKKPRFYLTGKKQVNLFTTNTISPLVSASGAYLVLEFLLRPLFQSKQSYSNDISKFCLSKMQ